MLLAMVTLFGLLLVGGALLLLRAVLAVLAEDELLGVFGGLGQFERGEGVLERERGEEFRLDEGLGELFADVLRALRLVVDFLVAVDADGLVALLAEELDRALEALLAQVLWRL